MTIEAIRAALPTGLEQWKTVAVLAAGTLFGWLLCPGLWLVQGPRSFLVLVLARAAQETDGYDTNAVNPEAGEVGILQYTRAGAAAVGWAIDPENDWRRSAFWSGAAAARHTRSRLAYQGVWWLLAVPVFEAAVFDISWRHSRTFEWGDWWALSMGQRRYWTAYAAWTGLTLSALLLVLGWLWYERGKR